MKYAKNVRDMLLLKDALMPSTKREEMSVVAFAFMAYSTNTFKIMKTSLICDWVHTYLNVCFSLII